MQNMPIWKVSAFEEESNADQSSDEEVEEDEDADKTTKVCPKQKAIDMFLNQERKMLKSTSNVLCSKDLIN